MADNDPWARFRTTQPSASAPAAPAAPPRVTTIVPGNVPQGRASPGEAAAVAGAEANARQAVESAAQRELTAQGRQQFSNAINILRRSYNTLKRRNEMVSADLPWYDNLSNWTEAQALGVIGNPTGGRNQSVRQTILNTRTLLVPLLMQATGANSRMIDSNAESQRFLDAVTDPTQSYETVMASLDNIDALFGAAVASLRQQTGAPSTQAPSSSRGSSPAPAPSRRRRYDPETGTIR